MRIVVSLLLLCSLAACSAERPDYNQFRQYQPKSILVLPPINTSNTLSAPEIFLASVAQPIGEAGYYVFPPLAVKKYFDAQGVPYGTEAKEISYEKLSSIFGADAALYTVIEEWGEKYQVLSAQNEVKVHLSLVDLKSGLQIWEANGEAIDEAGNKHDLIAALVGSLIHGLFKDSAYDEFVLSQQAITSATFNKQSGLLIGNKRPNFSEDERGRETTR